MNLPIEPCAIVIPHQLPPYLTHDMPIADEVAHDAYAVIRMGTTGNIIDLLAQCQRMHQGAKVATLIKPLLPLQLRVSERGNGFPSVGHYATDGTTVWRIIDLCGGIIKCGTVAAPNYIEVVAVDAGEPSDFEEDQYASMYEASRLRFDIKGGAQ